MKQQLFLLLFAIVTHFQPIIIASHEPDPIREQARERIRKSLCCRILTCQLRNPQEQYGPESDNHQENCNTPLHTLQCVLKHACHPLFILTTPCWVPCCACYESYKVKQLRRENYEQIIQISVPHATVLGHYENASNVWPYTINNEFLPTAQAYSLCIISMSPEII